MNLNKIPVVAAFAALLGTGAASGQIFAAFFGGPGGPATLYTISPVNGSPTVIGLMHADTVSAIALAPDHATLYAIGHTTSSGFALLKVNTSTGAATAVGPTGVSGGAFQDMDFRPSDGKLFGYAGGSIYTVSTTTGMATFVGDTGKFPFGNALAFSSSNILYSANERTLDVINQSNGSVTSSIPLTYSPAFGGGPRANAMKFHPNGTLYASVVGSDQTTQKWSLGIIDTSTGVVTFVFPLLQGTDALAIGTPAPSSWLLVTIGIAGTVLYRRMRRSRTASGYWVG